MRKLITTTFVSLDGVMQAPGGPEEDESGRFEWGGWTAPYWQEDDASIGEFMSELMNQPMDLLLGRKTYDIFAGYWPKHTEDEFVGKPFAEATKYVASRGTPDLTWERSVHIQGDLVDAVRELKQADGPDIQVHGSGDMIQTLLGGDVIDEIRVITFPVLLGNGKRLFAEGTVPTKFNVTRTVVGKSGVFAQALTPAGKPEVGTVGA